MNTNGTTNVGFSNNGMRRRCICDGPCGICEVLEKRVNLAIEEIKERVDTSSLDDRVGLTIASDFNVWRSISKPDFFETRVTFDTGRRSGKWRTELRTVYGTSDHGVVIKSHGTGLDKGASMFESYNNYLSSIVDIPHVQMESVQGDATQSSVMENNTIITEDTSVEKTISFAGSGPRLNLVSTEDTHSFDSIMNRWMPFSSHTLSTSSAQGDEIFYYNLPEAFFTDNVTPNLTQFRNFIFGELDIELRIIVNAHRFQCGKLIVCVLPDPYQGLTGRRTMQNAVQFPHVIIDLNGNNHGVLEIPFKYRRPLLRLISNPTSNKGVRGGVYGAVAAYMLAPLRTGPDQPLNCVARTFFRFKRNQLAGMSYQVSVQMDDVRGICEGVGMTIKGVEKTLLRAGKLINWDKPQDVVNIVQTVPRPRLNFFTGVGLSDAVQMRVSPYSTDILPEQLFRSGDPQSVHDISRIWGYHDVFSINQTDTEGTIAYSWTIDPASAATNFPSGTDATGVGVPSPFMFINGLYNFWSGPIEMRFDFVSNDFITGTVQVAFEPGRPSTTELQGQSTYTKTFHLGEQRSMSFIIPYINDTVMRRTGIETFNEFNVTNDTTANQSSAQGVRMQAVNSITLRVINPIRCAATTTSLIDVLVFIRAGSEYVNLSPVMSSWLINGTTTNTTFPAFPGNFPTTIAVGTGLKSIPDLFMETKPKFSSWAKDTDTSLLVHETLPNLYRATETKGKFLDLQGNTIDFSMPSARAQMDNGEKEDLDPTLDFSQGPPRNNMVVTDRHDNIIDLLRRPVHLWSRVLIGTNNAQSTSAGNFDLFYIPVMPPGPMWYPLAVSATGDFMQSVCKTPQAALVSTFRHWRGSLRFTIIVNQADAPVYVSYLPHNGTLFRGKVQRSRNTPAFNSNIGPHSCGLTTEMIIPQINPTITIEVPYECELDYLLTQEDDRSLNYAWREKNCYNNGHLVLYSTSSVEPTAEIWVSAGDSFYLCDFIGTYRTRNRRNPQLPSDNNPSVTSVVKKADFRANVSRSSSTNRKNKSYYTYSVDGKYARTQGDEVPSTSKGLYSKVVGSKAFVPVASVIGGITGIPLAQASVGLKGELFLETAKEQYEGILAVVKETITNMSQSFNQTLSLVDISSMAMEYAIEIFSLVRNFDIVNCVCMGLKMFLRILQRPPAILARIIRSVTDWFSKFTTPREQFSGVVEGDHSFVALIAGLVCNLLNVNFSSGDVKQWCKEYFSSAFSFRGFCTFNAIFMFIKNYYSLLESMVRRALGISDPYVLRAEQLRPYVPHIQDIMGDIATYTSALNKKQCYQASFRFKYWKTYMQALTLKNILVSLPPKDTNVNILRQCDNMIKHANENATSHSNSPIRYVPYVICVEGKPGIGKSFMVDALATLFFEALGITSTTGNDIYLRNPKAKHWDGYDGQKIIHMDDIFCLSDSESVGINLSDMFALKTTAQFIPEKAHLEEKGKTENPLCVIQTTNTPFPTSILDNMATCPTAILRRRDIVIKAIYDGQTPVSELDPSETENMKHLTFQIYDSSISASSLNPKVYTWPELREHLAACIMVYHDKEMRSVKYRFEQAMARMGSQAQLINTEFDPTNFLNNLDYVISEDAGATSGFLPSELLKINLGRIKREMENSLASSEAIEQVDAATTIMMMASAVSLGAHLGNGLHYLTEKITCSKCQSCMIRWKMCANAHRICNDCIGTSQVCTFGNSIRCAAAIGEDVSMFLNAYQTIKEYFTSAAASVIDVIKVISERVMAGDQMMIRALVSAGLSMFSCFIFSNIIYNNDTHYYYDRRSDRAVRVFVQGDPIIFQGPPPVLNFAGDREEPLKKMGIYYDTNALSDHFNSMKNATLGFFSNINKMTDGEKCKHHLLLAHSDYLRYMDGYWQVTCDGGNVMIPDNKSECYECVMEIEFYKKMVASWWGQNYQHLHRKIIHSNGNIDSIRGDCPPPFFHKFDSIDRYLDAAACENSIMTCLKTLGLIVAGVGALYGVYRTCSWYFGKEDSVEQIEYSGDSVTRHFRKEKEKAITQILPKTQDDNLEDVVVSRLMENACSFRVTYASGLKITMAMTGLKERMAILPRHYVVRLLHDRDSITKIELGRSNDEMSYVDYAFDVADFDVSDTSDIAIFHLPYNQVMFKNIVKFMQTDDDLAKPMTDKGRMLRIPSTQIKNFMDVNLVFKGYKKNIKVAGLEDFIQNDVLVYNYSSDGACGSLVLKKKSQRPIVAMHFAGLGTLHSGEGYGVLLSQNMMADLRPRSRLEKRRVPEVVTPPSESTMLMPPHVQVDYVGEVEKAIYMPKKSKIKKSIIQSSISEIYGTLTSPCYLSREEKGYPHEHSPLVAGCMKHGKVTLDFTTTEMLSVRNYIWDRYLSVINPTILGAKLLSLEDVVSGYDGIEGYDPMKLDTSIGYPLNTMGVVSKREDIQCEREIGQPPKVTISDRLMQLYNKDMEDRKNGIVPETIFTAFLKDERRPHQKKEKLGSTRIFLMSSAQYTLAKRQYYLHYTAAQMANRDKLYSAVGIRCDSREWSELAGSLLKIGKNIFTLDYSDFGPAFNSGVNFHCHQNLKRWLMEKVELPEDSDIVLDSFIEEHVNSMHIMRKLIMIQRCGGPSGDPGTVNHNSDVNAFYVCLAWQNIYTKCYKEMGDLSYSHIWSEFEENVYFKVYGDDLIASVSDKWRDIFNAATISNYFAKHKIVSTDASKAQTIIPYTSIYDSTFLKRTFTHHPKWNGEWLAPLEQRSITEACQWIFTSDNDSEATEQNAEASIRMAYGHGVAFFDKHKDVVNSALRQHGLKPISVTWEQIDRDFFPEYYGFK